MNKEEFIIWLRTLLDKRGLLNGTRVRAYLKGEKLDNLNLYSPLGSSYEEKIYLLLNDIEQLPVCKICRSPVKFKNSSIGYQTYCSLKCSGSSSEVQSKKSQAHWNKTEDERKRVVDARKQGIIDKYGVANVSLSEEVKAKRQKTFDEKWGGNPMKDQEIKYKLAQKIYDKYGVINASQYSEFSQKRKESFQSRYGTDNPKRIGLFKRWQDKLNIANFVPKFTEEELTKVDRNKAYLIECKVCGAIRSIIISNSPQEIICPKCNPPAFVSSYEKEIAALIESWGITNIRTSVRNVINPYELDIYLPDYKLAIEFHGIYWHSELSGGKGRNYHLNKLKLCKAKDVDLIQIFEDEWIQKKDIIISLIKNRLGLTQTKY